MPGSLAVCTGITNPLAATEWIEEFPHNTYPSNGTLRQWKYCGMCGPVWLPARENAGLTNLPSQWTLLLY